MTKALQSVTIRVTPDCGRTPPWHHGRTTLMDEYPGNDILITLEIVRRFIRQTESSRGCGRTRTHAYKTDEQIRL